MKSPRDEMKVAAGCATRFRTANEILTHAGEIVTQASDGVSFEDQDSLLRRDEISHACDIRPSARENATLSPDASTRARLRSTVARLVIVPGRPITAGRR